MYPPRPRLFGLATLLMLASACQPESVFCPQHGNMPQFVCPPGSRCAAKEDICIYDSCGDGIVDLGEMCDDGNKKSGDGCKADCKSDETCGNGVVDTAVGEVCDDGNTDAGDHCSSDCLSAEGCGNTVVDTAVGEACDDGNTDAGDDCTFPACQLGVCGDGIVKLSGHNIEECDDGGQSATCDLDCTFPACGDGLVNVPAGETCDPGTITGCDGDAGTPDLCDTNYCNGRLATPGHACTIARCGDGYRNAKAGEKCDTEGDSPSCDDDCTLPMCGDGHINTAALETCDILGGSDTDTCDGVNAPVDEQCTGVRCGDGYRNSAAGEECDVAADTAACDGPGAAAEACTLARCGDGYANAAAGEECDDGNTDGGDDCTDVCRNNICGDGRQDLQGPVTEACDDGNTANETECPYPSTTDCTYCNSGCSGEINLLARYCGDGVVQRWDGGSEVCDDGNANACGTCSASCGTMVAPSVATGWIDALPCCGSGYNFKDGDIFTLDDGLHPAITFEIERAGGVTAGHVSISVTNGESDVVVAGKIRDAINGIGENLRITATTSSSTVSLTHDFPTALGNGGISEGVACTSFSFQDMAGGLARDCGRGTGCISVDDCSPLFDCDVTTHTCKAPVLPPTGLATDPVSPSNRNTLSVTGKSAPGTTVQIYGNATCTGPDGGSAVADANGNFSIQVTVVDNTTSTYSARATDDVGSTSACSSTVATYVEDSTAPASPTFTGSNPSPPADNTNPSILGSSEANSTVWLYTDVDCLGAEAGSDTAIDGGFSIAVTVVNDTTTYFYATAQDVAGNVSACSTSWFTYVEDSTAPAPPTITGSIPASPANDTNPTIEGLAEADSLVRLYITDGGCGGVDAGSGTATDGGTFSIAVTVADGGITIFQATATDTAGNPSGCSPAFTYTEQP